MWRKMKKIIFEFVFNSLLIWNFQNSKFEFQISEPTRLFRRQSVNWNRCSIFFHWTKKSLCWNLMKSSRDPCKTKKEAKVGSSTYTKVFWLSLFFCPGCRSSSALFACVGEKLVEKKRKNGGKEREEKNYWEMSNGVVVIRCLLFSDETYKYHPDFVGFWKYHEDIFHFYHRKA